MPAGSASAIVPSRASAAGHRVEARRRCTVAGELRGDAAVVLVGEVERAGLRCLGRGWAGQVDDIVELARIGRQDDLGTALDAARAWKAMLSAVATPVMRTRLAPSAVMPDLGVSLEIQPIWAVLLCGPRRSARRSSRTARTAGSLAPTR